VHLTPAGEGIGPNLSCEGQGSGLTCEGANIGIRVASISEPSSLLLGALAVLGLLNSRQTLR
jgi:hypothetical protein